MSAEALHPVPPSSRLSSWAFGSAFAAVAALRLYYCTLVPRSTGDLPRHLFHGLYALRDGLSSAGTPLASHASELSGVSWSHLPYNYPVVALGFFSLVASISPTLFLAKLLLTLLDALTASVVYAHTGRRWLAFVYFASPSSIWWVSGEGQFEPLQSFFVACAILSLPRSAPLAFALLALGIQAKLTAAALVPMFLIELWSRGRARDTLAALGSFALAFSPSLLAALRYPLLPSLFVSATTYSYNPYHWNVFDRELFAWNSGLMIGWNAIASYGALFALIAAAFRADVRSSSRYFAPIAFLLFCKLSPLCQHWYMLSLTPLLLPIDRPRLRSALFVCAPLLDVLSTLQLAFGPLGFVPPPGYYDNVTAFTRLVLP